MSSQKIYLVCGFHVNFYQSWRGDRNDRTGFGIDSKVIQGVLKIMDEANAAGKQACGTWDCDNYWSLEKIMPRFAPDVLEGIVRRVRSGVDEAILGNWNNGDGGEDRAQSGRVERIGPDVRSVKVGDNVLFNPEDRFEVEVQGEDIGTMSESEVTRWRADHVGFIFQLYNLMPVLTALQNVELPLLLLKMSGAERKKRAKFALDLVGLADRLDHYPRQLSGGQEQRVAIARAVVSDPKLLLADEPTGDLDRKAGEEILQLLDRLNTEFKKTIIMVTHDPHAAERAHRLVHLDKGVLSA